jgi:hypothetical protein
MLGIDLQDPCPGAPAIATTMGRTERAHLDGGFDTSAQWDEIATGVRMAAGLAGEPTSGPVLVFLDCAAGTEAVPARTIGSETIVAPVNGTVVSASRRPTSSTRRSSPGPTARSSWSSSRTGAPSGPRSTPAL